MTTKQIISPVPGIFYRKLKPEQPPYVSEGEQINEGDVIGLVEVMKTFLEVKSDSSGKLVKFLIEDEGEVTAGQVIAEIES